MKFIMKRISIKLKNQLNANLFYKKCCLCEERKVQWHHCWTYNKSQINEVYAILPVCKKHHNYKHLKILKWISICLMDLEYMQEKYPKFNWYAEKQRLTSIYGEYIKQGENNGKSRL